VTVVVIFVLSSAASVACSRSNRGSDPSVACSRSNNEGRQSLLGGAEAGVLAVLVAVACAAVSLRWLEGYGIALASIGGLAALPFVNLLMGLAGRDEPDLEIAGGGSGVVAALAAVAFVRVFAEATSGSGVAIRIFQSYILTGLILGGVLMLIQSALAANPSSTRKPLGDALKGLVTLVLGVAIVFAAAYFWRQDAISGLLLGAAAGLFMLIVAAPFFGKQAGAPDLAVGLPMLAAVLVPAFLSATLDLTRDQKITVMIWTLAIVAFVVMVTSVLRLRRAR